MAKLRWRVKLVAEVGPGVTTETELACIERPEQASLAELGLTLAEAKRLTAALQAEVVPAQMAALSACPQECAACGRRLAARGHYGARFRSLLSHNGACTTPVCRTMLDAERLELNELD